MAESISLLDFLLRLLGDEDLREDFAEDPEGTLSDYNLTDLTAQDVHDALILAQDSHTASFDRNFDTGWHSVPPVPAHAGHAGHEGHGESSHKEAVEYINKYITNNYVDDRDTIVDNSVNQNIDNRGGIFDQDIDVDSVVASGDGAVAAGDDIRDATVVTGDDNIVGDDNDVVRGDGNTVAYGGNANSAHIEDVTLDDGSAISVGGNAGASNTDNDTTVDVDNFGDGATTVNTAGAGGAAAQSVSQTDIDTTSTTTTTTTVDSHNQDNDTVEDSFNTDTDIDFLSNNDVLSHNQGGDDGSDGVDVG